MTLSPPFIRELLHRRSYLILFIFGRQSMLVAKNMDSGVRSFGENFCFLHLLVVWSWKRCLATPSLSFIICKAVVYYPTGAVLIIKRTICLKHSACSKLSTAISPEWSSFVHWRMGRCEDRTFLWKIVERNKNRNTRAELVFNIAKNITKIRDWGVTDSQFQLLKGFLVTVWIQKNPFIYLFFGSSVFNIHKTDILVLTCLL